MVGALLLGFVCGVIARVLMPGDVFRNMSGPTSWAVSLGLGLAGALVGYVIFTLIVVGLAGYFLRRRQPGPPPPAGPSQGQGPPPIG